MDWDYHSIQLGAQQGWVCPLCGRANAPWVSQCNCRDVEVVGQSTNTYKIDYTRDMTSTGSQIIYNNKPVTISSSQPEDSCEDCLGGCDLCYYCKNGDHYAYKGWRLEKK